MNSRSPLLIEAIAGRIDGRPVVILDADENSVVIEHSISELDPAAPHRLQFTWEGIDIDLPCRISDSVMQDLLSDRLQKVTWHARATFVGTVDPEPFRRALEAYRGRLGDAQRANLSGESAGEPASAVMLGAGDALRRHKPGFTTFIFRQGAWTARETRSSAQPLDGFTVAEFESEEQIRLLKLAYEEADREGRDLIRRFAAASIE